MRALRIFMGTLAVSAFLIVGTTGVQAAEKETLKLVPVSGPSASAQENLVTAISKVAESTVPAVVLIQVQLNHTLFPYCTSLSCPGPVWNFRS
jgi:hypothetical protein